MTRTDSEMNLNSLYQEALADTDGETGLETSEKARRAHKRMSANISPRSTFWEDNKFATILAIAAVTVTVLFWIL